MGWDLGSGKNLFRIRNTAFLYLIIWMLCETQILRKDTCNQCCGSGSAFIWPSWIRVRIGNADSDLDQGASKLTQTIK
jgi:hypothetical protein